MRNHTRNEWRRRCSYVRIRDTYLKLKELIEKKKAEGVDVRPFINPAEMPGGEGDKFVVKLTVVLDYYQAKETYSRIGLLRG